jgi:predicted  nucleic acid-binding Zn-ribbon protein
MTSLEQQLRAAAGWTEHQSDPAPDWDGLLVQAADRIRSLEARLAYVTGERDGLRKQIDAATAELRGFQDQVAELRQELMGARTELGWTDVDPAGSTD